jgi:hypothetical protein
LTAQLIELLLKLYREGDRWLRQLAKDDWRKRDIDRIYTECRVIKFASDDDVQRTLRQYAAAEIPRPQKAMVLEPWDKSSNVLLLLEPVFGRTADNASPKLSLFLGAVLRPDGEPHFMGYRYEAPEGGPSHNFYHAQPILGFDRNHPVPYALAWYPVKWPTHALRVTNDCQLLLALMLAFQGMQKVVSHANTRSLSREHADALIKSLTPT